MSQPAGFGGVPAAPNRCEIEGKVLSIRQDESFPDKWLCEIEITKSKDVVGPNFARVGLVANASIVGQAKPTVGSSVIAEAEYVGGPKHGNFVLSRVKSSSAEE